MPNQIHNGLLKLPATPDPQTDPNTLDDYKEDVWTPAITFGGNATGVTYNAATSGYYTKIGNMVFFTGILVLTSKGSDVGAVKITGLPYTSVNNNAAGSAVNIRLNVVTFANQFQAHVVHNQSAITLEEITEAGTMTALEDTNIDNTSSFVISGFYRAQ